MAARKPCGEFCRSGKHRWDDPAMPRIGNDGKRRCNLCNMERIHARRRARRSAAVLARPRCAMCPNPLNYRSSWSGPGVNYNARTCSRKCSIQLANWFRSAAA